MTPRYLLAIPVFNERRHVVGLLARAAAYAPDIVVVDDGSTDGTSDLLAKRGGVRVITHCLNLGYGRSLVDAFRLASRERFEWVVTMDCDEQHDPAIIPRFVEEMRRDDADVISGSRYLKSFDGNGIPPIDRRIINYQITAMLNRRLGLGLTDAFCGFKAYRVSALDRMALTVAGYAMPLQFWVQAARLGLRIRELAVPLVYNDPRRSFGGGLDDPQARLRHYLDVFEAEMGGHTVEPKRPEAAKSVCAACG